MQNITIAVHLAQKVPEITLSCIECDVKIQELDKNLWNIIEKETENILSSLKVEEISRIPAIAASRKAYKLCGKDPARYRLSAEALLRRVIKRKELYQVNNVVDLLNLVSVTTGFSIGGYDAEKIEGDITFGIGENNEPYTGIGRGDLNIEFIPVLRDNIGAFGTSTSDSVRTSVTIQTNRFLMIIIDYGHCGQLEEATNLAVNLLKEHASANNFEIYTVTI